MNALLWPALLLLMSSVGIGLFGRSEPLNYASRATWAALATAIGAIAYALVTGTSISGLSASMGVMTLFVGAIVLSYSVRYLRADRRARAFAVRVLVLLASIVVFVSTDHALLFALAWLLSSVQMVFLIGHFSDWHESKDAMKRAWVRLAIGDAALLSGLALLGWQAGSLNIDLMIGTAVNSASLPTVTAAFMIVIAAMARCALVPFSTWLTHSMTAPTPVSAIMHAGFVNAGGFLLIFLGLVIEQAPAAQLAAIILGSLSAIWGTALMLVRPDIKRSLAGSTVAQMGFMLMTCGLGAYAAALWHLLAHGLFKAWLFLGSGSAIGSAAEQKAVLPGPNAIIIGCLGAALAATALSLAGFPAETLVALGLAVGTAISTLVLSRSAPVILLTNAGLVLLYCAGLLIAEAALERPLGEGPGGTVLALALLLTFLAAWGLQARFRQGRAIPRSLYARLLSA